MTLAIALFGFMSSDCLAEPLQSSKLIRLDGRTLWIDFRNQRLSHFCYSRKCSITPQRVLNRMKKQFLEHLQLWCCYTSVDSTRFSCHPALTNSSTHLCQCCTWLAHSTADDANWAKSHNNCDPFLICYVMIPWMIGWSSWLVFVLHHPTTIGSYFGRNSEGSATRILYLGFALGTSMRFSIHGWIIKPVTN